METILLERKEAVAWVWLNRPRQLNAMNQTMLDELRQAFETLGDDESVKAVVLSGRGRAFSAGFDVAWMAGLSLETLAQGMEGVRTVYDTIEACPKPLIAAVPGPAAGGGLLLILVTDFCLASEEAFFGVPEVKLGFFPPLDLVPRLERLVGLRAAKRLVMTGESVDAAEAWHIGLVNQVVPPGDLQAEAQALAERLATLPPAGVQLAKAAFAAARYEDYHEWETARLADCWASPEREAAMQAFLKA